MLRLNSRILNRPSFKDPNKNLNKSRDIRFNIYYDRPSIKTIVQTENRSPLVITNDERALALYSTIHPSNKVFLKQVTSKVFKTFDVKNNYFTTILDEMNMGKINPDNLNWVVDSGLTEASLKAEIAKEKGLLIDMIDKAENPTKSDKTGPENVEMAENVEMTENVEKSLEDTEKTSENVEKKIITDEIYQERVKLATDIQQYLRTQNNIKHVNMSDLRNDYFDKFKDFGILLFHELPNEGEFGAFYIKPTSNQNEKPEISHRLYKLPKEAFNNFEVFACMPLLKTAYSDFGISLKDKVFLRFRTYKGKNMNQEGKYLWKFMKDLTVTGLPFSNQAKVGFSGEAMNPLDFCGLISDVGGFSAGDGSVDFNGDWSADNMPNWSITNSGNNSEKPIQVKVPNVDLSIVPVLIMSDNGYFSIECPKIPEYEFTSKIPETMAFCASLELKTTLALKLYFDHLETLSPQNKLEHNQKSRSKLPSAMILPPSDLTDSCVYEHWDHTNFAYKTSLQDWFMQNRYQRDFYQEHIAQVLKLKDEINFFPASRFDDAYFQRLRSINKESDYFDKTQADSDKTRNIDDTLNCMNFLDKYMLDFPPDSSRKVIKVDRIGNDGYKGFKSYYTKARWSKSSQKLISKSYETRVSKLPEFSVYDVHNFPRKFTKNQYKTLTRFLLDAISLTVKGGPEKLNNENIRINDQVTNNWLFMVPHQRGIGKFGNNQVEAIVHFLQRNKFEMITRRTLDSGYKIGEHGNRVKTMQTSIKRWKKKYELDTVEGLIQEFLFRTGTTEKVKVMEKFHQMDRAKITNKYLNSSNWFPVQSYIADRDTRAVYDESMDDTDAEDVNSDRTLLNCVKIYQNIYSSKKFVSLQGKELDKFRNDEKEKYLEENPEDEDMEDMISNVKIPHKMTVQVDNDLIDEIKLNDMFLTISPFNNNKSLIEKNYLGVDFSNIVISELLDDVCHQLDLRFDIKVDKYDCMKTEETKLGNVEKMVGYEIVVRQDKVMKVMTIKKNHFLNQVDLVEYVLSAAVNDIYRAVKDKEDKMDSMDWFEVQRNLKVRINDLNRMVKPGLIEKYNYIEDVEPRILLKTGYKESSD